MVDSLPCARSPNRRSINQSEDFPCGDTLGVVFSFLSARELLQGEFYLVCKEWKRVLTTAAHAWGPSLDLSWTRGHSLDKLPVRTYAWHRVEVRRPVLFKSGALHTRSARAEVLIRRTGLLIIHGIELSSSGLHRSRVGNVTA